MRRIIRRTVTVVWVQTYTLTCEDETPARNGALDPAALAAAAPALPPGAVYVDSFLDAGAPLNADEAPDLPETRAAHDDAD
jgi:hypothetical protein